MSDGTVAPAGEKTPGQLEYEKFCVEEWKHGRLWNAWALVLPEDRAEWEMSAVLWGTSSRS